MDIVDGDILAIAREARELLQSYSDPVGVEILRRAIAMLETKDLNCHILKLLEVPYA